MIDRRVKYVFEYSSPDSKVHGTNMGPTWVLLAPDGPHVGPMNLAIRVPYLVVSVAPAAADNPIIARIP